ncbi:tetratricopeptide repeat protein [Cohnella lubricantis]|uniref:Tetratricopeptide repeat protein n=1 Tax=Cohnella lubricantis TaxID=2163172 RepID=A0A841T7U4_9BACL|nr:tetratricopeptide repeat protein [Cohnella lubricantis]MBB6676159.1 tetratricopeptide repeat protein [Cohnella lubricantis]MBP2118649.1 tetratricopeptide (TPR) repeat protein [Cohnella lubricantis]
MRIRSSWSRWMAARQRRRGRSRQSLRWYERLGESRMKPEEKIDYARLLQELDRPGAALRMLDDWIADHPHPDAYACRAAIYQDIGRDREAVLDLTEAIRLHPAPGIYWYRRALAHNALGDVEQAVFDMQEAVKRAEGARMASAYYELGCIYLRANRSEEAIEAFDRVLSMTEYALPLHRFRLGEALEDAGRRTEALAAVRTAAEEQSLIRRSGDLGEAFLRERTNYSETAVHTLMAVIDSEYGFRMKESQLLEEAGRTEEAIGAIALALQDYPEEEDLLLRQGALLRLAKQLEASASVLKSLNRRNPDRLAAYLELFATYRAQEKWREAIETLRTALERHPNQTVIHFWLVDGYRDSGALTEAWALSLELTRLEPEDPMNWRQQGELAIDLHQFAEADEALTKALALAESAECYLRRSFARYMADRFEEAHMDLQAAIEMDPKLQDQAKTAYAAAEIYMGMDNRELAEQEYGRAIRLEPGNPHLFERRAQCRFGMKRLQEALDDCRAGLALDPGHLRLIRLQGFIHWRLDEYEAALHDLQHYIRKAPKDEQGHRDLATIYSRLNMYDEAVSALNRALEISPFEAPLYLDRASLFYHHLFERGRASDDLAQWLLYAGGDKPQNDRFTMLGELAGFDDDLREDAKEKYLNGYGSSRYLS